MKMKRRFRAKKAFSAVIASLILMLLAVAAGVVVYAYVMGWIGGATGHDAGQYGELSLDTAYAYANATIGNQTITAYVRNVGGKLVTPNAAYVNDYNVTSIASTPADIAPNAVASISINATTPGLTKSITYQVKIACTDGTILTFSVTAK
jgi:hypothetical protein